MQTANKKKIVKTEENSPSNDEQSHLFTLPREIKNRIYSELDVKSVNSLRLSGPLSYPDVNASYYWKTLHQDLEFYWSRSDNLLSYLQRPEITDTEKLLQHYFTEYYLSGRTSCILEFCTIELNEAMEILLSSHFYTSGCAYKRMVNDYFTFEGKVLTAIDIYALLTLFKNEANNWKLRKSKNLLNADDLKDYHLFILKVKKVDEYLHFLYSYALMAMDNSLISGEITLEKSFVSVAYLSLAGIDLLNPLDMGESLQLKYWSYLSKSKESDEERFRQNSDKMSLLASLTKRVAKMDSATILREVVPDKKICQFILLNEYLLNALPIEFILELIISAELDHLVYIMQTSSIFIDYLLALPHPDETLILLPYGIIFIDINKEANNKKLLPTHFTDTFKFEILKNPRLNAIFGDQSFDFLFKGIKAEAEFRILLAEETGIRQRLSVMPHALARILTELNGISAICSDEYLSTLLDMEMIHDISWKYQDRGLTLILSFPHIIDRLSFDNLFTLHDFNTSINHEIKAENTRAINFYIQMRQVTNLSQYSPIQLMKLASHKKGGKLAFDKLIENMHDCIFYTPEVIEDIIRQFPQNKKRIRKAADSGNQRVKRLAEGDANYAKQLVSRFREIHDPLAKAESIVMELSLIHSRLLEWSSIYKASLSTENKRYYLSTHYLDENFVQLATWYQKELIRTAGVCIIKHNYDEAKQYLDEANSICAAVCTVRFKTLESTSTYSSAICLFGMKLLSYIAGIPLHYTVIHQKIMALVKNKFIYEDEKATDQSFLKELGLVFIEAKAKASQKQSINNMIDQLLDSHITKLALHSQYRQHQKEPRWAKTYDTQHAALIKLKIALKTAVTNYYSQDFSTITTNNHDIYQRLKDVLHAHTKTPTAALFSHPVLSDRITTQLLPTLNRLLLPPATAALNKNTLFQSPNMGGVAKSAEKKKIHPTSRPHK